MAVGAGSSDWQFFQAMKILAVALITLTLQSLYAGDLQIEDAWIRAVPPSSKATAAFMTLVNKSGQPVLVTGGSCPVAGEIKPMITTKQGDGVKYNGLMPSWKFDLTDEQIAAVINDLHLRWHPGAPPVTEEMVRQIREQTAGENLLPTAQEAALSD